MSTGICPRLESAAALSRGADTDARRGLTLLAALALLGGAGCAGSGGSRDSAAVGTDGVSAAGIVEGVERERFAAMVAVDRPKLERMLSDSLRYCHSSGACESKAEFLANLTSGQMQYRSIEVQELQPRPVGTAVLVQGRLAIEAQQAGQPLSLRLGFTDVYELRGGIWQMVAWQSTRLP